MPAYLATVEWDEGCTGDVYFVEHAITARRAVCDQWQDGELGGATVARMHHLDKYEADGSIPMIEMIYMGWWAECYHCGMKLTADEQYDDDDNEFVMDIEKIVGTYNGPAFCCQDCSDIYFGRRDVAKGMDAKHNRDMETAVIARLGTQGITFFKEQDKWAYRNIVQWDKDTPWIESGIMRFDIPGTENGAIIFKTERKSRLTKETSFYSYYPDAESKFNAFFKERTGITLRSKQQVK